MYFTLIMLLTLREAFPFLTGNSNSKILRRVENDNTLENHSSDYKLFPDIIFCDEKLLTINELLKLVIIKTNSSTKTSN